MEQYSSDNTNWTENNILPVLVDPSPYHIWGNWGAGQWDVFFLDSSGDYITDININPWDYDSVYNTIIALPSGCTDPNACNYDIAATYDDDSCEYPEDNYNCDGNCIATGDNLDENGIDCSGDCGGDDNSCLSLYELIIPDHYNIFSIYPNPFNPITNITYGLPQNGNVKLIVYNIQGRQVQTIVNKFQTAGYQSVNWNATLYPSGVYLIRMNSGNVTQTQKVVLVK